MPDSVWLAVAVILGMAAAAFLGWEARSPVRDEHLYGGLDWLFTGHGDEHPYDWKVQGL